jgi:hypothetical protein
MPMSAVRRTATRCLADIPLGYRCRVMVFGSAIAVLRLTPTPRSALNLARSCLGVCPPRSPCQNRVDAPARTNLHVRAVQRARKLDHASGGVKWSPATLNTPVSRQFGAPPKPESPDRGNRAAEPTARPRCAPPSASRGGAAPRRECAAPRDTWRRCDGRCRCRRASGIPPVYRRTAPIAALPRR